ncbi:hypothetical protein E4P36_37845 [Streptomyces sp. 4R-3d]|nr:hypothetical protein E4P36_37845 [Streptomyces sp. 4R-3d]
MRSQGGGGRHGGAMPTDDNAASARTRDREPGKIGKTPPRGCQRRRGRTRGPSGVRGRHMPPGMS